MRAERVGALEGLLTDVAGVKPDLVQKFYGCRRVVGAAKWVKACIGGRLAFLDRL